jgi:adenosylcobinamide kinase/adenosylcobinamide-phosphate guanylyltransferase
MIELILGGARSGKSLLAEQRAAASNLPIIYIATGQAGDAEMALRITHHRASRPAQWQTVEEPIHLAAALAKHSSQHGSQQQCIVVDCLTLWLTNLLLTGQAAQQAEAGEKMACPLFTEELAALFTVLNNVEGHIIFVSNEVGMGIVPMGAVNRLFIDEQGRLNQRVARLADRVTFVAAGMPLALKG